MARLFSSGFELNDTSGKEGFVLTGNQNCTIQTGTVRSGTYALQSTVTSSFSALIDYTFAASGTTKQIYIRIYLYTTANPPANNDVMAIVDQGSNVLAKLRIQTDGTIALFDAKNNVQVGSASSAITLSAWNCLELFCDDTTLASGVLTGRLNGTQFATGTVNWTGASASGLKKAQIGFNSVSSQSGTFYFDDIAINDTSGASQNSWPGPEKLLLLKPNASGDGNTFATQTGGTAGSSNNYTRVNEVPPDDATTFNGDNTLNHEDLFNVTDSGIGASDTVNIVQVGARFRNNTADATTAMKLEVEKTSGGTIAQSSAIIPNTTTWNTNTTAAPFTYPLTLYQDPDNANWTKTTLDSMQIGYKITTGGTNRIDVSAIWAYVGYTPVTIQTQSGLSRITVITLQALAGLSRITAKTKQLQAALSRITALTKQLQAGLARMTIVTKQIQNGISRITVLTILSQTGLTRLTQITKQSQSGISRISVLTIQTLAGKGSLLIRTIQTITGKARVTTNTKRIQSGTANITSAFGLYKRNSELYIDE